MQSSTKLSSPDTDQKLSAVRFRRGTHLLELDVEKSCRVDRPLGPVYTCRYCGVEVVGGHRSAAFDALRDLDCTDYIESQRFDMDFLPAFDAVIDRVPGMDRLLRIELGFPYQ